MILLGFFGFLVLVGLVTFINTRGHDRSTAEGFFLAGRSLSYPMIALSLFLTNLSTEQMVGMNGASFMDGILVMAWDIVAVVALILMALYFLPKFLASGISTIPEFLELRYNHTANIIANVIFLLAYIFILLPIILYSSAMGLSGILDLKGILGLDSDLAVLWFVVWTVGSLGAAYSLLGGLKTMAVSDLINGVGLLVGGFLILYFGLQVVSGGAGVWAGLEILYRSEPGKFNSLGGSESSVPFYTLFSGILLLNVFYWCTNQQIIQRTFGASSLAEGQKGVLLMGALQLLAPFFLVLPGIIAFYLFKGVDLKPDKAYGELVKLVLPPALSGVFAAVMVGAILSSFNSALNGINTLFSLGIYRNLLNKSATEREIIRAGKIFCLIVVILAMFTAPMLRGQDSLFAYLQKMNGMYFIPIFSVVFVGLVFRRVPAVAGSTGLIAGIVLIGLGYFMPVSRSESGSVFLVDYINEFHYLGIVFVILVLLMLVIGWLKPRKTKWSHKSFGSVDMSEYRFVRIVSIFLILVVIGIYIVFADTSVL